jgi:hypothetical protein
MASYKMASHQDRVSAPNKLNWPTGNAQLLNHGAPFHYFSYKTTHPVAFLGYFFSPAVQFVTTVSGGADA